ncbi:MAG: nucleotidyltransferase family protein [Bacillota bacterium]|nr:nucleotidyltransferase family protein [Bacillota bacterium]
MAVSGLRLDSIKLADLCYRYKVARLEVMGSFARGEAGPESDIDILVTFEPDAQIGLEFFALQNELEELAGRRVDLLSRNAVECSPNKYFRWYALRHTEPLYEST